MGNFHFSPRGSEPQPNGSERSGWPLRQAEVDAGRGWKNKAKDKNSEGLSQSCLERKIHFVSSCFELFLVVVTSKSGLIG